MGQVKNVLSLLDSGPGPLPEHPGFFPCLFDGAELLYLVDQVLDSCTLLGFEQGIQSPGPGQEVLCHIPGQLRPILAKDGLGLTNSQAAGWGNALSSFAGMGIYKGFQVLSGLAGGLAQPGLSISDSLLAGQFSCHRVINLYLLSKFVQCCRLLYLGEAPHVTGLNQKFLSHALGQFDICPL